MAVSSTVWSVSTSDASPIGLPPALKRGWWAGVGAVDLQAPAADIGANSQVPAQHGLPGVHDQPDPGLADRVLDYGGVVGLGGPGRVGVRIDRQTGLGVMLLPVARRGVEGLSVAELDGAP